VNKKSRAALHQFSIFDRKESIIHLIQAQRAFAYFSRFQKQYGRNNESFKKII